MGILLDIANGDVVIEKGDVVIEKGDVVTEKGKVVIAKEVQSASDDKAVTKTGTAI